MKSYELIAGVIDLFQDESKWAKEYYAYDPSGESVEPDDEDAVCFCTLGAMEYIAGKRPYSNGEVEPEFMNQAFSLIEKHAGDVIIDFNDDPDTTLPMIRNVLEKAHAEAISQ